jgi:hypothetical protein
MKRTLALAVAAICLTPVSLLADGHSQRAEHRSSVPAKKLETDERLRAGMSRISASLGAQWESIRRSSLKSTDYVNLAKDIGTELSDVVAKCKLPAETDRVFHEVLADMNRSLDLMNAPRPELQRSGALALAQTLRNYGAAFDHPGWSPKF